MFLLPSPLPDISAVILSLFDKTELSPRDTRPQRGKKRARQIVRNIADLCQKMWGVGGRSRRRQPGGGGGDERRERLNVLMREMCGHRAAPARPAETRPET